MKIVDLTEENKPDYFACLEEWSEDIKDAGNHKECWYKEYIKRGLCVKLALDDNNVVGGMIQYLPIEHWFLQGKDLYFVLCIWVHGFEQGRGNFQKKGFGKALLQAAEEDVKAKGAKGLAVWGVSLPFWMKASWFKKQGYVKVDKQGIQVLLWKPFSDDAIPPKWSRQKKVPKTVPGKVKVTALINGWCPAQNAVFERAKKVALELGDNVIFEEINTLEKDVFLEWGIADALYIDNKLFTTGPPPSYEKIKKEISKRLKKISK